MPFGSQFVGKFRRCVMIESFGSFSGLSMISTSFAATGDDDEDDEDGG